MSTNMIRRSPAPSDRAASTYSFSLIESVWPRTMRPTDAQLKQLKSAQARLKVLEEQTKKALAIQKAAYAKLAKNKHNLAKAMAADHAPASLRTRCQASSRQAPVAGHQS